MVTKISWSEELNPAGKVPITGCVRSGDARATVAMAEIAAADIPLSRKPN
jgi:hypothetical protein